MTKDNLYISIKQQKSPQLKIAGTNVNVKKSEKKLYTLFSVANIDCRVIVICDCFHANLSL